MQNILIVTGGAGFVGFNFIKHYMSQKSPYHSTIFIDKMGYATIFNRDSYRAIIKSSNDFISIENNINNLNGVTLPYGMTYIFGKYDIVNFASESHVDNSISSPSEVYNDNACIPSNLIAWIGLRNIRKFVNISTDEIYGDLDCSLKDDYSRWFTPESPMLPNNPYAASKAAQDCYLRSMKHTFGLNLVTVRMANQFGPHQHPEKMLPATIYRILRDMPIKIYGNGKNIRQWTPVTQTVKHIYSILTDDTVNNTTIHLGAAQTLLTNNEVVDIWRKILKNKYGKDSAIQYIEDRKGHDRMYAIQPTLSYAYSNVNEEFESAIDSYAEGETPTR